MFSPMRQQQLYIKILPINRIKNGVMQQICAFMHRDSWLKCPMHALASQCAVGNSSTEKLFPHVSSGVAGYINNVFRYLSKELHKYTSHAVKRTAATDAIAHPQINASWVVLRAGWKGDSISTFFTYLAVTPESDAYVGKALAGWRSLDRGGVSPTIDSVKPESRDRFAEYAINLYSAGAVAKEVKFTLVGVLLLWYREVKHEFPNCALITKMESFAYLATVYDFVQWAKDIKDWWLIQNRILSNDHGARIGEVVSEESLHAIHAIETMAIENKQKIQELTRLHEQLSVDIKIQLQQLQYSVHEVHKTQVGLLDKTP